MSIIFKLTCVMKNLGDFSKRNRSDGGQNAIFKYDLWIRRATECVTAKAAGPHLVSFRTQKLSPPAFSAVL